MSSNMKNESDILSRTLINPTHVEQAFREYTKDDKLKLVKVDGEMMTACQGYTANLFRLKLHWKEEDAARHGPRLPKLAILKSISLESMEKMMENFRFDGATDHDIKNMTNRVVGVSHRTECAIYQLFDDPSTAPVPMALAYAAWPGDQNSDRPPMLLIEDLSERGRVLGGMELSLSYQQMLALADAQADLHAWCLASDNDKWKEKLNTMEGRVKEFESFMETWEKGLNKAKEAFPDVLGKLNKEKIREMCTVQFHMKYYNSHRPWLPDVMIHGDYWSNNVMFNKLTDGTMGDQPIAVIDWQLTALGNPMVDLGHLLVMSFDPELREVHFEDLIKRYYHTLEKKLSADRMPKDMTLDRVLHCARQQVILHCLLMVSMYDLLVKLVCIGTPEGIESERKREKILDTTKKLAKHMMDHLDISASD